MHHPLVVRALKRTKSPRSSRCAASPKEHSYLTFEFATSLALLSLCLKRPAITAGRDAHGVGLAGRINRQLQMVRFTFLRQVGDAIVRRVILPIFAHVLVHLIHGLNS